VQQAQLLLGRLLISHLRGGAEVKGGEGRVGQKGRKWGGGGQKGRERGGGGKRGLGGGTKRGRKGCGCMCTSRVCAAGIQAG